MAACVFCDIAAKKIPTRIAGETDDLVAFHDTNAQAPTHVLIVPRKHVESVADLTLGEASLAGGMLIFAAALARLLGIDRSGYRLVVNTGAAAGQTVPHLHLHLLGGRDLGWPPG
ncbi:MAG TPA: histidine triad nucleotide-binding protein [Planctomycetota bacterium]|nr:histidine triad nucleotide-binding protein [Planctomycetota bacterium]